MFTSRPIALVVPKKYYVFPQYINIVSIDQKLMCSFQYQSFPIFLDLHDCIFKRKDERKFSGLELNN